MRHYLQFTDFTREEYEYLFKRAAILKAKLKAGELYQPLVGQVLAMIFENHPPVPGFHLKPGWPSSAAMRCFCNPKTPSWAAVSR